MWKKLITHISMFHRHLSKSKQLLYLWDSSSGSNHTLPEPHTLLVEAGKSKHEPCLLQSILVKTDLFNPRSWTIWEYFRICYPLSPNHVVWPYVYLTIKLAVGGNNREIFLRRFSCLLGNCMNLSRFSLEALVMS